MARLKLIGFYAFCIELLRVRDRRFERLLCRDAGWYMGLH